MATWKQERSRLVDAYTQAVLDQIREHMRDRSPGPDFEGLELCARKARDTVGDLESLDEQEYQDLLREGKTWMTAQPEPGSTWDDSILACILEEWE